MQTRRSLVQSIDVLGRGRIVLAIPMTEKPRPIRNGAAMLETALVLSVFLTLVLGLLDFGLAVLNRNTLEAAACRLARAVIVHGSRSEGMAEPWGPETLTGTADDGSEMAQVVAPVLAVMPPSEVQIQIEWPDGSHAVGQRVIVTLSYDHEPIYAGFFGTATWKLQAVSTMHIQH